MEGEITCIYAKFGKCKKEDCNYHHPKNICCDKTCEIHLCSKKHPRHCRYFWGFNLCRNEDSCKFKHSKDPNHTDVKKNEDLEKKYDNLVAQFKDLKKQCIVYDDEIETLKQQLQEQALEIHVLRGYVFPDASLLDSLCNSSNDVTSHHDDENGKETQMIIEEKDICDMDQVKDDDDQCKIGQTICDKIPKNPPKNDFKDIKYLEAEIIKIKDFVSSSEKMVPKRINETRQRLKSLTNEMKSKHDKSSSGKMLDNMLETLIEKVMKIKTNFRKIVSSELEKCAEKCRKEMVKMEKKKITAGR